MSLWEDSNREADWLRGSGICLPTDIPAVPLTKRRIVLKAFGAGRAVLRRQLGCEVWDSKNVCSLVLQNLEKGLTGKVEAKPQTMTTTITTLARAAAAPPSHLTMVQPPTKLQPLILSGSEKKRTP